jgi:hypothetical protein
MKLGDSDEAGENVPSSEKTKVERVDNQRNRMDNVDVLNVTLFVKDEIKTVHDDLETTIRARKVEFIGESLLEDCVGVQVKSVDAKNGRYVGTNRYNDDVSSS